MTTKKEDTQEKETAVKEPKETKAEKKETAEKAEKLANMNEEA